MSLKTEYMELIEEVIDYLKTGFRTTSNQRKADSRSEGAKEHRISVSRSSPEMNGPEKPPVAPKNGSAESTGEQQRALQEINQKISRCRECALFKTRRNTVPGEGSAEADIVFIGEAPGEMEDIKGRPFVGRAGELLDRMLKAITLTRQEVYITNIVKCRPPQNRTPLPEEIRTCFPYLEKQLQVINPCIICCLGAPAIQSLINSRTGISRLRGQFHRYKDIPVIATYHPAAVLRFPGKYRRPVWNDLQMLRDYYADMKKQ
ncbi:MAG: uracil-DNA glycosylase [Spirochaetota bacterium]